MSACRVIATLLLIALPALANGCGSVVIHLGRPVDPQLLDTALRIGESTREHVLAVLGEPSGRGMGLLPIEATPKAVWSYYYEQSMIENNGLRDSRRTFLWVLFDGDRYDGYMWFSSLAQ